MSIILHLKESKTSTNAVPYGTGTVRYGTSTLGITSGCFPCPVFAINPVEFLVAAFSFVAFRQLAVLLMRKYGFATARCTIEHDKWDANFASVQLCRHLSRMKTGMSDVQNSASEGSVWRLTHHHGNALLVVCLHRFPYTFASRRSQDPVALWIEIDESLIRIEHNVRLESFRAIANVANTLVA